LCLRGVLYEYHITWILIHVLILIGYKQRILILNLFDWLSILSKDILSWNEILLRWLHHRIYHYELSWFISGKYLRLHLLYNLELWLLLSLLKLLPYILWLRYFLEW
jgi:hypothetical protein